MVVNGLKERAIFYVGLLSFLLVTLPLAASGTFTVSATPSSISIPLNGQGVSIITTAISGGFNSSISLSASGVPLGATVNFNPTTIGAPGAGSSTMTITVVQIAKTGTFPITVTANGGGVKQTTTVTLTITGPGKANFTISAIPSSLTIAQGNQGTSTIYTIIGNGFGASISLSASGLPTGATASFSPQTIPSPGDGTSTMTITVGGSTPTGTYPITVTGNGGGIQQNTTVTLTVTGAASFTLSASPASLSVQQGKQGNSTITATISGGFNSSIALSASGAPSGTTVSFNPNPIPAPGSGTSTMTITVGGSTPTGTYPITVTGNGGGIQQNTTVTLTVTGAASFTLSASPASLSIQQGHQGNSTITATISGGFNSSITLSVSGAPSGTTVSFNPNPIPAPGSGTSTMTITVGGSTPTGTYPITVTGNGGGIQQNTTVTLTVTGTGSFTLSIFPPSVTIAQGNPGAVRVVTSISGSFNSSISLSVSGLPSGTTASFNPQTIPAPGKGFSTMTITVGGSSPVGSYTFTVTGTGGGIKQSAMATLKVIFALDTYSGLLAAPVPGCTPTGYFQALKVKGRWVYADPDCNAFYQRAVFDANTNFILRQILQDRYGNDSSAFAKHSLERMTGWGFNSIDIYYLLYMLPVGWGNNPGAPIKVPFVLYYSLLKDAWYAPQLLGLPERVKDICRGFNSNGYNSFCSNFIDVFDPKFQTGAIAETLVQEDQYTGGFNTDPWVLSIQLGDPDYIFAIKGNGAGTDGAAVYPHPAMMVATVNFQYSGYLDNTLYSKYAWINFLQTKYGNIAALNASWNTGGFYTSFGDAGGFGDGTGVLDEDGRHTAWFGTDIWNRYFNLVGVNPNLVADMDQFLYQWTYQAFSVQVNAIKPYDQNHLFSCGPIGGIGEGGVRPPVLQALKDAGCNVIIGNWNSYYPSVSLAGNQAAYDATGLPTYLWYGITSQADSPLSNYPEQGAPFADYATQELRGQQYATDQQAILNAQGSNGDHYIVGTSFWSLTDNSSEDTNWGLISYSDNAYDGKCAVIAPGTDQYGYPCGGEQGNYGNFLDSVTQSNADIVQQIIQQIAP